VKKLIPLSIFKLNRIDQSFITREAQPKGENHWRAKAAPVKAHHWPE